MRKLAGMEGHGRRTQKTEVAETISRMRGGRTWARGKLYFLSTEGKCAKGKKNNADEEGCPPAELQYTSAST